MARKTEAKWYILHTFSGYESLVKKSLEQMAENSHLQDVLIEVKIPTETVIVEEKSGKRKAVEQKLRPGYVFVKLVYSSEMWYRLTNTRGVTGFVGPNGKALELEEDEVRRFHLEEIVRDFDMQVGDFARVVDGPFEGQIVQIKQIDSEHQKATVIVKMFDRETPIEVDFNMLEKRLQAE